MQYRVMQRLLAVAAVALLAAVPALVAQDRGAGDRPAGQGRDADRAGTAHGNRFEGKIARVDAARHQIVLSDVHTGGDRNKSGTGDRTGAGAADRDANRTFDVAQNARITLDGKNAELRDLMTGMHVRVHVKAAAGTEKSNTGGTGSDKSGTGGTGSDRGGAAAGAHRMTVDRIEASSKGPLPPAKDTGTTPERKGSDRP